MANVGVDIAVRVIGGNTVTRDLKAIGTSGERAASGVKTLQIAAQRARFELVRAFSLVAIIGTVTGAVRIMSKFSDSIATIRGVAGITGKALDSLKERARELGATTVFTASEAADAMVTLAKTGADATQILFQIGPSLLLARAGGLELNQATEILINTMANFGIEASKAGNVADILSKGANQTSTTVEELAAALKNAAPFAVTLGISLKETIAALGVLAKGGFKGTRGGTILKNVFVKMIKQGRLLKVALNGASLEGLGLFKILSKFKTVNPADIQGIFGLRGGPGVLSFNQNLPLLKEFITNLDDLDGVSKKVAAEIDKSLGSALTRVGSAYTEFILSLNQTENFTSAFDALADGIRFIASNLKTAGVFAGTLMLTLSAGLVKQIGIAIFGWSKGMTAFTVATKVATFAVRTLFRALLIGFAIEGIISLVDEVDKLNQKIRETGETLSNVQIVSNIGAGLKKTFITFTKNISISIGTIILSLADILAGAISALSVGVSKLIGNMIQRNKDAVKGFIFDIKDSINALAHVADVIALNKLFGGKQVFDLPKNRPGQQVGGITEGVGAAVLGGGNGFFKKALVDFKKGIDILDFGGPVTGKGGGKGAPLDATGLDPVVVQTQKGAAARTARINLALIDFNRTQNQNIELSKLGTIARRSLAQVNGLVNKSIKDGNALSGERIKALKKTTLAANNLIEVNKRAVAFTNSGVKQAQIELIRNTEALNAAQKSGGISASEYARKLKEVQLQALATDNSFSGQLKSSVLELSLQMDDLGKLAGDTITNGFKNAEDALVNFVTTGKLSFKSLINSMIADIARLLIRQAIIAPLVGAISGAFGGLFGGGGATSNFSASATGGAFSAPIGPDLGFTPVTSGFAHGGSFNVGGMGGTDSQLVQFRASPNERVTIETPGQRRSGGGGGVTIINNIDAKGAEIGVEEKIVRAIAGASPLIINKARGAAVNDTREMLTRRRL